MAEPTELSFAYKVDEGQHFYLGKYFLVWDTIKSFYTHERSIAGQGKRVDLRLELGVDYPGFAAIQKD